LGTALIVVALVLNLVLRVLGVPYIECVAYAMLIIVVFRMLSRNITARRRENDRFLRFWAPVRSRAKRRAVAFRDRGTHRYFVCPSCKTTLRVPKGRGKLQITCPRCGERFIKKS
jgi:predicted RNA-binding Zn-ribbon protein involved in translation (DUF1610 family)